MCLNLYALKKSVGFVVRELHSRIQCFWPVPSAGLENMYIHGQTLVNT